MNTFTTAGKKALLDSVARHTWKAALYTAKAKLDASTARYTTAGELRNGDGYTTGGLTLTGAATGSANDTAWLDFADATWNNAAFSGARYLMIYDATDSDRSYAILDFGADKAGQGDDFTYKFPPATADAAIIRI